MRASSPLAVLVLCAAAGSTSAAAQAPPPRVQARVGLYTDDDRTTVWRPRVSGQAPVGAVSVGASWTADVISSASIDVVTVASRPVEETRHELGATIAFDGEDALELSAGYLFGTEPDHTSHSVSLSAARDLGRLRLWHATAGLGLGASTTGTVVDDRFEEHAWTGQAALSLSRIVDPVTVVRAALEGSWTEGFQSSPYRAVRLGHWTGAPYEGDDPDATPWVFTGVTGVARETHPDRRLRLRLVLDGVHDLGSRLAVFAELSGYADDWGVEAGSAATEVRFQPTPAVLLRLGARGYLQSAAWFWRQRYVDAEQTDGYVTGDRELGPMSSVSAHVAGVVALDALRLDARIEIARYDHPEYDLRPSNHALAVQLGVAWEAPP